MAPESDTPEVRTAPFVCTADHRMTYSSLHNPGANEGAGGTLVMDPGDTIDLPEDTFAPFLEPHGWERPVPADEVADDPRPDGANDLVAWIGTDPERAQAVIDSDEARKTVLAAANAVLSPTQP